jgi:hypothetical protein
LKDSNLSDLSKSGKQSAVAMSVNCSIVGSDNELELFYWVLHRSNMPFSVGIRESKMVDHLKKVIKKKKEPELDHIAAYSIIIWKVSAFSWRVLMRIPDIREAIFTHSF